MMCKTKHLLMLLMCWCAAMAQAQTAQNPLSVVAEYNLKTDGTFEQGDKLSITKAAFFKWAEVKNVTSPQGYHIPTKEEMIVISGIYPPDETVQTPYPDFSWNIDKVGDEVVNLFGKTMTLKAHYYGEGKYVCYAIRFKGGDNKYLSAYRWEPIFTDDDTNKTKIKGLKVTCRLLGNKGASVDVKDVAKEAYWQSGNADDVVRYFPAAGYGNYTKDGAVMDQNKRGRYWTSTARNQEQTGAWGFGFDADFVMVYPWVATSRYCLRCFKDKVETPDPIPAGATISMELNKTGVQLAMAMAGPQKIEVDFGDGKRQPINLASTGGMIEGVAKGTRVNIFAKGVTNFRASDQMIKTINFDDMAQLKTLELGFNKLTALSLEGMSQLEHLNLVSNRITAIDLKPTPKLKYLSLSKNFYISQLDLSQLAQLEELYVGTNALSSLSLDKVPNLRVLDVAGNAAISNLDLSKVAALEEFFASKTTMATVDLTQNTKLRRLNLSNIGTLEAIKFSSLASLQSCYLAKTILPKAQLDAFLTALPNVKELNVYANERMWKKQLEVSDIAAVKAGEVDLKGAQAKGWLIDVLEEAWSVGPKNPCMVLTTAIPVGKEITINVENFFDPFWVDWGKWWSSFLQAKPYSVVHAVRQPEIKYYSRGLMTLDCSAQKLTKLTLPNNDQTYALKLADNALTEVVLAPNNAVVSLDLRRNNLSQEALNAIFNSLRNLKDVVYPFATEKQADFPQFEDYGKIYIEGNPGALTCSTSIAKDKGFTLDINNTAVNAVAQDAHAVQVRYNQAEACVEVTGTHCGDIMSICNLQGAVVYRGQACNDYTRIEVANLSAGVYVLAVNGSAHKFIIK